MKKYSSTKKIKTKEMSEKEIKKKTFTYITYNKCKFIIKERSKLKPIIGVILISLLLILCKRLNVPYDVVQPIIEKIIEAIF